MTHGRMDVQVTLTTPFYGFSRHCIPAEAGGHILGDRTVGVRDVSHNTWWLPSRQEDLTPGELAARLKAGSKHLPEVQSAH